MARTREDMLAELKANPRVQTSSSSAAASTASASFRELALQGVRVLLVERGDFCGACSSAPSRMIHGGLRYLENGEISLVREVAARARRAAAQRAASGAAAADDGADPASSSAASLNGAFGVLRAAGARRPSAARWRSRSASTLYDCCHARPPHACRGTSSAAARETRALWPDLPPTVRFSATYHDAWISHPERLGIELIRDGLRRAPAGAGAQLRSTSSGRDGERVRADRRADRRRRSRSSRGRDRQRHRRLARRDQRRAGRRRRRRAAASAAPRART